MFLPDYHIHTARCGHARGTVAEYIEQAIAKGLPAIGFADHLPMYWLSERDRDPGIAMHMKELAGYMEEIEHNRKHHADLEIMLGIEADFIPGYEKELSVLLDSFPFDYVLGSVHFIDGWGFDNPDYLAEYEHKDIDELYEKYFTLVQQAATSGLFDIIAHPDLIKKFGFRSVKDLTAIYEATVRICAQEGVALEVNTAGLRVPAQEIYPSLALLKLCKKSGVRISTGSDAHEPHLVGYAFDQAKHLLQAAGYEDLFIIKGRDR